MEFQLLIEGITKWVKISALMLLSVSFFCQPSTPPKKKKFIWIVVTEQFGESAQCV